MTPEQKQHYDQCLANGCSQRMADMLAHQAGPAFGGTEHNFLQGRDNNQEFNKMPKDMQDHYLRRAKKGGVNPRGKVYISQLANDAGDPNAWVSSKYEVTAKARAQGRSVVK